MAFASRHLLGLENVSASDISLLLDTAESLVEVSRREVKKLPTLRGKTVVNLFVENSTRTRTSFEIAAKRMSADAINISTSSSSMTKGETLEDTARNLAAMAPDCIVVRHPASGAARFLTGVVDCSIINAGDGSHEHPTQALLDLLTIRQKKKRPWEDLVVTIVGDILHSRVARSNLYGLRTLGAKVRLCGPPTLLPDEFRDFGAELFYDVGDAVRDADVIMMLRIQRERQAGNFFPSLNEYARYYCLTADVVKKASPDVIILHPGPINRGIEISSEVADGPYSVIMSQVANGVALRMALLYQLIVPGADGIRGSEVLQTAVTASDSRMAAPTVAEELPQPAIAARAV
ncbi:MAG TPA: aspartate carbamoyltransferase catalytic subunit [Candidatus Limnocylindrales bacterium]|nr:aspartate carbamoyltransferase catalytic subunit [Candidatus Limnocylindrales bacterium]